MKEVEKKEEEERETKRLEDEAKRYLFYAQEF